MSNNNDSNVKGFAVTDQGWDASKSNTGFAWTRRFSPRMFDTRDAADRFVMTLPKSVRRDALVVPVLRSGR